MGYWGKVRISEDVQVEEWLPLEAHCRDVAVTFRTQIDLPKFRDRQDRAADMKFPGLSRANCTGMPREHSDQLCRKRSGNYTPAVTTLNSSSFM